MWFCVSTTAGFCEEIIFRGYLQRQFATLSRSMLSGIRIIGDSSSARLMVTRAVPACCSSPLYGFMFGLLAWWRKSLRPGMIAHAWHDALSGAVMRL